MALSLGPGTPQDMQFRLFSPKRYCPINLFVSNWDSFGEHQPLQIDEELGVTPLLVPILGQFPFGAGQTPWGHASD